MVVKINSKRIENLGRVIGSCIQISEAGGWLRGQESIAGTALRVF